MSRLILFLLMLLSIGSASGVNIPAQQPLFTGNSVPANIFFILDDSGSMSWEKAIQTPRNAPNGMPYPNPFSQNQGVNVSGRSISPLNFAPVTSEERYELCYGYNRMAYDPIAQYSPWLGLDENNQSFPDYSFVDLNSSNVANRRVRQNPRDASGALVDLQNHVYYQAQDTDGNGTLEWYDCQIESNQVLHFRVSGQDFYVVDNAQTALTAFHPHGGSIWVNDNNAITFRNSSYNYVPRIPTVGNPLDGRFTWNLTGLPAGSYHVFAAWENGASLGTGVRYRITGTGTPVETTVNQTINGNSWQRISASPISLNASSRIELIYNPADKVGDGVSPRASADAILLSPVATLPTAADTLDEVEALATADARIRVSSLPLAAQQNYARWYSYYRNRDHVMKRAVTELVTNSQSRMGVVHINTHLNATIRWDVSLPQSLPIQDMSQPANKNALLQTVINVIPFSGTPLRGALWETGLYFDLNSTSTRMGFVDENNIDNFTDCNNNSTQSQLASACNQVAFLPAVQNGACQQNFVLMFTDGFWNEGNLNTVAAGSDDTSSSPLDDLSQRDNATTNRGNTTLADIAMHWYKADLNPILANEVNASDYAGRNTNNAQHLSFYGVAFGVLDSVNQILPGTELCAPKPFCRFGIQAGQAFSWPTMILNLTSSTIDDLLHAAWNARGLYANASDPAQLIRDLQNALADIEARAGTFSAVSFNSSTLQANATAYVATFNTGNWSGNLNAFAVAENANQSGLMFSVRWTGGAAKLLDDRINLLGHSNRFIFTANNGSGVNFLTASLSSAQTADVGGANSNIRRYVAGDRSLELQNGGSFRNRASALGNIVNSSSYFIGGAPVSSWDTTKPQFASYGAYVNNASIRNRTPIVYVGANDGMLHGFNANTGQEQMAFIPSMVYSSATNAGLKYLTDITYAHRYYVDGPINIVDVQRNNGDWMSMLAAGLGAGGKGVYALDVTNPAETVPNNWLLWEFNEVSAPSVANHIGHVQGLVVMACLKPGIGSGCDWKAVFGNGYNSTSGDAGLFVVDVDKAVNPTFNYISTGSGGNNGLSAPVIVDWNLDGYADFAYAGDLNGDVWRFNLQNNTVRKLFDGNPAQPITAAPTVAFNPNIPSPVALEPPVAPNPNILVLFGSGRYFVAGDNTLTTQQYYTAVWDDNRAPATGYTRNDLAAQTVSSVVISGQTYRSSSGHVVDYGNVDTNGDTKINQKGWSIALPNAGERVIYQGDVRLGEVNGKITSLVYFNTLTPGAAACGATGGGFLMAVDLATGGAPLLSPFDLNGDGRLDTQDMVVNPLNPSSLVAPSGKRLNSMSGPSSYIENYQVRGEVSSTLPVTEVVVGINNSFPGRLSWQELVNE